MLVDRAELQLLERWRMAVVELDPRDVWDFFEQLESLNLRGEMFVVLPAVEVVEEESS